MNWEIAAAIGEVAGGIGVVITLIYLSIQIRQNTKASRAATAQQMTDNWVAINLELTKSSTLPFYNSLHSLKGQDYQRALGFWRALFHQWANNHYQYTQGVLEEALFVPTEREIRYMAKRERVGVIVREAWSAVRHIYNDSFAEFMENILQEEEIEGEGT